MALWVSSFSTTSSKEEEERKKETFLVIFSSKISERRKVSEESIRKCLAIFIILSGVSVNWKSWVTSWSASSASSWSPDERSRQVKARTVLLCDRGSWRAATRSSFWRRKSRKVIQVMQGRGRIQWVRKVNTKVFWKICFNEFNVRFLNPSSRLRLDRQKANAQSKIVIPLNFDAA